jgi:hypothetical protein
MFDKHKPFFLKNPVIDVHVLLSKFTERSGTLIQKIISSFIILTNIGQLFVGIDSSGFKATHSSQYYAERAKLRRRKYIKLLLAAEVLQQIMCTVKIGCAPARHDTIDFWPLITKTSKFLLVVIGDKGYDSNLISNRQIPVSRNMNPKNLFVYCFY